MAESSSALGYEEFTSGWQPLLAAAMGVACCTTVLPFNMLGAVIDPLRVEFGWSRSEIQFGYFLFTLASAATFPLVGAAIDRFGARRLALVGLPALAAALGTISLTGSSLTAFYVHWIIVGIVGAAATPITFTRLVNDWFDRRLGLALAITLGFAGVAAAVQQVGSSLLVERFGWRGAFLGSALLPLALAWPIALAFFKSPGERGARARPVDGVQIREPIAEISLPEALRGYRLHVLTLAIVLVTLGISGTMVNFKPLLADAGISLRVAAYISGVVGLSVVVGRLGMGLLIDRYWAPGVAFPVLMLPALSCWLLGEPGLVVTTALLAGALVGLATGAEGDLMAYLTVRYFGLRHYGRIYGLLFGIFLVASGIAPFLFGLSYDWLGSYRPVMLVAAGMFIASAILLLTLGSYPVPAGFASGTKVMQPQAAADTNT